MADFKKQKERLKTFISSINLTKSAFEKSLGLSNGYINSMRKGLGYDKLELLSNLYVDLNIGWLLTGEGEMLKKKTDQEASGNTIEAEKSFLEKEFFYLKAIRDKNADLIKAMDKIEEKEKDILRLKAEIESLKGMLDKQEVV